MRRTKEDQNQTKIKLDETIEELKQTKNKLKESIDEVKETKSEINKHKQSVIVSGYNKFNQLGENPNNNDHQSSSYFVIRSFVTSVLLNL